MAGMNRIAIGMLIFGLVLIVIGCVMQGAAAGSREGIAAGKAQHRHGHSDVHPHDLHDIDSKDVTAHATAITDCDARNNCFPFPDAPPPPPGKPNPVKIDCNSSNYLMSQCVSQSSNDELFRLNPKIKSHWDGLSEAGQTNKMYGSGHGGTWDEVQLPPQFRSCGISPQTVSWTPKATNGGCPGYLTYQSKPLVCNTECCNAASRFGQMFVPMTSSVERLIGFVMRRQTTGCPSYNVSSMKFPTQAH